ncbi:MAG: SusC/RagA family TonB-linked outer membrane protein, partial [Gemmatimonadota bacterium]|nr:SusC/RagA family TonB-linked outer membrane protein [Gemmatimonadota bacterium]
TNEAGRYSITVPGARVQGQGVTVTARRVGFRPQNIRVTISAGTVTQDFELAANPLQLGEVVITGAGTATEVEKLGNVRNAVSAELIVKANEPNLVQALAGKAPNVIVNQSAGDPGAGSSIRIRGVRTLNGSVEPLFIVDGVPMDNTSISTTNFNVIDAGGVNLAGQDNGGQLEGTSTPNRISDINPNDIENVEILKGAAAAAIYGARAANGVVLITTKRGRAGATRYSLNSSYSFDRVTRFYPLQRSFGQGLFNTPPAQCEGFAANCLRSWGPRITGESYDHAREAFTTGNLSDNVLSVSGGNERTTFFLSSGFNRHEGVMVGPHNWYNRATVRLSATHRLLDNLNVGGNFSYADARGHLTQRGNNTNGLLLGLLRTPPNFNNMPYLVDGSHRSYNLQTPTPDDYFEDRVFANPFYTLNEELNETQVGRVFGNVTAEYLANSWLRFNYILGSDYATDERLEACPQQCTSGVVGGRITEGKVVTHQIDHNLTATARHTVNANLSGTLTVGQNLNYRAFRTFSVVGRTLIAPQPFNILNTLTRDPPSDYQTEVRGESYFGQLTVDLFNQLFLTGAMRRDGSSTFDRDNRYANFPKASAAWTFTNLYNPANFLTFGKLRISYGEAGQEPQPYLTTATFSGNTLTGQISQGTGFTPTQAGRGGLYNSVTKPALSLQPERTKELEAGFDIGFLRDKVDLSVTLYNSHSEDVILITPVSPSTGYQFEAKNAGKIDNWGTEVTLNLRPLTRPTYSWDISFGYGRNVSRVRDIAGADFLLTDNNLIATVAQVGYPLGVIRSNGWVRCGLSPDNAVPGVDLAALCANAPFGATYIDDGTNCSHQPGMPCGDDVIRVIADPNPDWTGNVRTSFRWKKATISGLLDIRRGGQLVNGTRGALYSYGTHKDTEGRAVCTGPLNANCTGNEHAFGEAGFYPGPVVGPGANQRIPIGENWYRNSLVAACPFTGYDEPCAEDAGFVKLREISVSYTFDQPWVARRIGVSSIDVRVAGRNLKTWTDYSGLDPEVGGVGGNINRFNGYDYFNLPLTRSFVFAVGLNR